MCEHPVNKLLTESDELRQQSRQLRQTCEALTDEYFEVLERSDRAILQAQELIKRGSGRRATFIPSKKRTPAV